MSDWKNKLDVLGTNAGETGLDKQAAWNKLHERMQKKPSRRKAYWFWAAAASLIIAGGSLWFMITKEKEAGYVKNITPKQNKKVAHPKQNSESVELPTQKRTEIVAAPKDIKNDVVKKYQQPAKKTVIDSNPVDEKTDQPAPEQITAIAIPTQSAEAGADSANAIASGTMPLLKNKLKVVRLNEVNVSPEEQMEFNRTQAGSSIKQKSTRSGLFKSSFGNTQSGDDFIKIKLSPQN